MKQAHKKDGQTGYILLSVMLLVAVMLLALSIALPRIAQQIKREKEEELCHRGMDYAMAIKRFVHKTGRYPTSLEQLEDTNHVRFLRKRYKDPMTTDGEWRLVHPGEAQIKFPTAATNPGLQGSGNLGQPAGSLGQPGVNPGGQPGSNPGQPDGGPQTGGGNRGQGQLGSLTIQNIGNGQPIGGGSIMGVASTSKTTSIKEFNEQTTYDGWLFVYEPRLEQSGGTGIVVAAPTGNAPPATSTNPAAGGAPSTSSSTMPK